MQACLSSVFDSNFHNFRVILVDNGSNDNSVESVKKLYDEDIDIIRSETNLGFISGNNLAFQKVTSKYVVLLNDDTVVKPDWLDHMVKVAEEDLTIAACQPKLLVFKKSQIFRI